MRDRCNRLIDRRVRWWVSVVAKKNSNWKEGSCVEIVVAVGNRVAAFLWWLQRFGLTVETKIDGGRYH